VERSEKGRHRPTSGIADAAGRARPVCPSTAAVGLPIRNRLNLNGALFMPGKEGGAIETDNAALGDLSRLLALGRLRPA
jgi:hypothetical protein